MSQWLTVRRAFYLVILFSGMSSCYKPHQQDSATCFFPITVGRKWGVIDRFGSVVIEPSFPKVARTNVGDYAPMYVGNEAVLLVGGGEWKCATAEGIKRINPPVDMKSASYLVENVGESMFAVYSAADLNRPPSRTNVIVDPLGKWSPPSGVRVHRWFSEGLIPIELDGGFGFADRSGRIVVRPQFDEVLSFADGLAPARRGQLWGYVNRDGKFVIAPRFVAATEFDSGHARVLIDAQSAALIDKMGRVMREWPYKHPSYRGGKFSEGLAVTKDDKSGLYGYLNFDGEWQIAPTFTEAGAFSEGIAAVLLAKRPVGGYVNKQGRLVIEIPGVVRIDSFRCGLGWVETVDHKGYVNRDQMWVWRTAN